MTARPSDPDVLFCQKGFDLSNPFCVLGISLDVSAWGQAETSVLIMGKRLAKKVLLIGWDAADWKVVTPLIDSGKMPVLERFINTGVMGNIATLNPVLSPMLWTSIATGMRPFRHGIHGFSEPDPNRGGVRPVTNVSRKVKAVWNILNQNGYKSNVIGWWPSHPAEPINGVMVSNMYQRAFAPADKPWRMLPGTVHPPGLAQNIANLRIHPAQLTAAHILPFVPKAAQIDQKKDKRLESLAKIIADCSTIHACATAVMQLEPWDFMAVYYDAIDHFCHGFMRYHPPRQKHISIEDFELYKEVVEGGYRFHDMLLDTLLKLAGEDTTVILISDHGFHPDHLRPASIPHEPAGPAAEHRPYGILVMKRHGIKRDELVFGTSLLDITPTILTLFGLPVGNDMQGKPIFQAFAETPQIETIPSWEDIAGCTGQHPPDQQIDPLDGAQVLKQLAALGYIDDPGEDKEKAAQATIRENQYNLAQDYIDANLFLQAQAILEDLWAAWSDEIRFASQLVTCYFNLELYDKCRKTIAQIVEAQKRIAQKAAEKLREFENRLEKDKDLKLSDAEKREIGQLRSQANPDVFKICYLEGLVLFAEGSHPEAIERLEKLLGLNPRLPAIHLHIGSIFLKVKAWDKAQQAFKKSLDIDPDNAYAHLGLCRYYLAQKRDAEAVEEALQSVGLIYHNPMAHFLLGMALHRTGYIDNALESLKVAIKQNPNFPAAYKRLAYIYRHRLKDSVMAQYYSQKAIESQKVLKEQLRGINQKVMPGIQEVPVPGPEVKQASNTGDENADSTKAAILPQDNRSYITIVSGLPRSGTSMMMQMLSQGGHSCLADEARAADANNLKGYFEYSKTKGLAKDNSWLPTADGKVLKVVAPLLTYLPANLNYRIIFMERDIEEIMASQKEMLKRNNQKDVKSPDAKLSHVFSRQLQQIKRTLSRRHIPTLFVSYYAALENPEETAQKISLFLDKKLDIKAMAGAVSKELYRQRLRN